VDKMSKLKVIHYINQFYAGIGGEEKADIKPEIRDGFVGPGMALNKAFGEEAEIVATVICGDSYFNENIDEVKAEIIEMIKPYEADIFVAGPAFNAGRYGVACGAMSTEVQDVLNMPAVTAMYEENPGADMYKKFVYTVATGNSAATMRKAIPTLSKLVLKVAKNETIGTPAEEGYLAKGVRKNIFEEKIGAERAVDMLVAKLTGEAFVTEYPMPAFDNVEPGKAIVDLSKAKIALVTSGGIVPKGNPDRIASSSAQNYGRYDIDTVKDLCSETYETAHGGFDPVYCNADSDRVLPVDILRAKEEAGEIGELYKYFYSTTGNGTSVKNSLAFAREFTKELIADGVDAVILTST
jgi:glycine reductase